MRVLKIALYVLALPAISWVVSTLLLGALERRFWNLHSRGV